MLYSLSLFNERQEGFFIGLFASRAKARRTAEHYLFAVPGFRDYPCTYEITEKTVIGTVDSSGTVHMISGWDEDAEGDETDAWVGQRHWTEGFVRVFLQNKSDKTSISEEIK